MTDRVFKNWISSILGVLVIIYGLFILPYHPPIDLEVTWWIIAIVCGAGILLIFSRDKLINLISKKAEDKI